MSEARSIKRMTPDEFFVWQAAQDLNYELVDGLPVLTPKAMTGASRRHDKINVNLLISLGTQLRDSRCQPYTDDIAVRLPNERVRRPDIVVDCDPAPDASTEAKQPRVLVEVLSPSTMRFDRLIKVEEYKRLSSVQVILLVASESVEVIVWRRLVGHWEATVHTNPADIIDLPEIGATIPTAEIYRGTGLQTIL